MVYKEHTSYSPLVGRSGLYPVAYPPMLVTILILPTPYRLLQRSWTGVWHAGPLLSATTSRLATSPSDKNLGAEPDAVT